MIQPVVVPYNLGDNPPNATLYYGHDCRDVLKQLPADSIHAVITSPPYWGLRDYQVDASIWGGSPECDHQWGAEIPGSSQGGSGTPTDKNNRGENYGRDAARGALCDQCGAWRGCLGLEPTPQMFVDHIVEVFREIRRVLHPSGTAWINLGDSYANDAKWGGSTSGKHAGALHGSTSVGRTKKETLLRPKSLVGIPWRTAFALQADGWILRSDVIWSKPNPLPESVEDRPTKAHEYIFMLAKSGVYFYDCEATKEPFLSRTSPGMKIDLEGTMAKVMAEAEDPSLVDVIYGRYRRTVWDVPCKPYAGAHFAVWPEALVDVMVRASTSNHGVCSQCNAPTDRQILRLGKTTGRYGEFDLIAKAEERGIVNPIRVSLDGETPVSVHITTGWKPTCTCSQPIKRPVILDPFSGSGTTGMVAMAKNRDYIGIDAGCQYLDLAKARIGSYRAVPDADTAPEEGSLLDILGALEDPEGGAILTEEPQDTSDFL